jgi:mannose-1-phosphate guanylyltransferase
MIICILAGGEGSRLWPISTPDNPKQIIKLNNSNSLIQNTYSLLKKVSKSIYIVSEESHYKKILKSIDGLSKKNMIVEPCRRGTTNCLLLAAKYISEQLKGKSDGERILFIHADHIFDNQKEFVKSINQLKKIKDKSTIVIGGRKPTYPGTKYGYVETKKGENGLYKVVKFVEKPDQKTADLLFSKPNYFWNEGFVSTSITSLVQSFQKYNPAVHEN